MTVLSQTCGLSFIDHLLLALNHCQWQTGILHILQHEKQTNLFRYLKFHDWLVTADRQTIGWRSAVTNQSWNCKERNKLVCFSCCNRSPQGHSWGLSTVRKEDFLVWLLHIQCRTPTFSLNKLVHLWTGVCFSLTDDQSDVWIFLYQISASTCTTNTRFKLLPTCGFLAQGKHVNPGGGAASSSRPLTSVDGLM